MSERDDGQSGGRSSDPGVDFTKRETESGEGADEGFDPYRFGAPEHPIPAEYAPPGYKGPTIPSTPPTPYGTPPPYGTTPPYGTPPQYGAPPPSAGQSGNPFDNPPGTPYSPTPYQYPQPGPYGYGAPPPPPYHGYPMPPAGSGKAIAALVFGILSIVLCFLFFFDGVFVILGLIFGFVALSEAKQGRSGGRNLAVAGLVCSIVGALLATLMTVALVRAANKCGGFENDNSAQWQTCVRENLFK